MLWTCLAHHVLVVYDQQCFLFNKHELGWICIQGMPHRKCCASLGFFHAWFQIIEARSQEYVGLFVGIKPFMALKKRNKLMNS